MKNSKITLLFFSFVLLIPYSFSFFFLSDFSVFQIPAYEGGIGHYIDRLNEHFDDTKPFKKQVTQINAFLDYKLLNETGNDVVMGLDGWFFFDKEGSFENLKRRKPFTKDQIEKISNNIELVQEWSRINNIKFAIIVGPNKESVYPEKISKQYLQFEDFNQYNSNYLISLLEETESIEIINPISQFREHENKDSLYYKNDTHWNSYGAFLAYQMVLDYIQIDSVNLSDPLSFEVKPTRHDDLATTSNIDNFIRREDNYLVKNYGEEVNVGEPQYPIGKSGAIPYQIIESDANEMSILVIGDSFSIGMLDYMTKDFGKVTTIHRSQFKKEYFTKSDPDVILYSSVERFLEDALQGNLEKFIEEMEINQE